MYNAKWFFNEFKTKVTEDTIDFSSYKHGKSFTPIISEKIIEIIESAELCYSKEYFRIDVSGWKDRINDIVGDTKGLKRHLWDLEIAVEHENANNDWTDELIKLIHIRCPLKVIIGYNSYDNRNDEEKLAVASKWMKKVNAFSSSSDEEYLIILGNTSGHDNKYSTFDYRGYLYNYQSAFFEKIG